MTVVAERASTSLVQYLGAEISTRQVVGKLANVVKNGQGGERTVDASSFRAGRDDLEDASIKIADYEAALAHMQLNGAEPLAAKAMAVAMVDAAKAQGVGVMSLLKNTGTQEIALVNNTAYTYLNQLRGGSSQLGGTTAIDNSKSLRSRYLLA